MIAKGGPMLASSRQQVHGWLPFLKAAGVEFQVICQTTDEELRRLSMANTGWTRIRARLSNQRAWTSRQRELRSLGPWANVIYIQEVLLPPRQLNSLCQGNKRLIFNFSDPIHLVNSPNHRFYHKIKMQIFGYRRFHKTLHRAQFMVVENDLLIGLAPKSGPMPVVMRAPIDTEAYKPLEHMRDDDKLIIGWAGSPSTLPYLEPVFPVLTQLAKRYLNLELVLFGISYCPQVKGVPTRVIPWSLEGERTEVPKFDIGLSYLPESEFNRYRGTSKLILYMACGVPIVSSPFGIGDQVVDDGKNGFLARTQEEWTEALETLITTPSLRRKMGEEGRWRAVAHYSYQAYLPQMLAILGG